MNLASASNLRKRGVPRRLEDLDEHFSSTTRRSIVGTRTFEYREGEAMRSVVTMNGTERVSPHFFAEPRAA